MDAQDKALYAQLDDIIAHITAEGGSLVEILHDAQQLFGYLSQEVQLYISRKLHLPVSKISGVVTFSPVFKETPAGQKNISVCLGTACFLNGSSEVLKAIENKLGIEVDQTTADGKYTLHAARCVGACGQAPVVMIDDEIFGKVKPGDIERLFETV